MSNIPYLTTGGICIKYNHSQQKNIEKIKKAFTIKHSINYRNRYEIVYLRGYKLFIDKKIIILPKFGVHIFLQFGKIKKKLNELGIREDNIVNTLKEKSLSFSNKNDFKWQGNLKLYQELVINKIINDYYNEKMVKLGLSGLILNLPTGHGKTFIGMKIMDILKLPTLIVCSRKKIADQWLNLLCVFFPDIDIGIYHSSKKKDGDVIVAVIDSLVKNKFFTFKNNNKINNKIINLEGKNLIKINYNDFFNRFDLVIFDECHNYCTNKNSKIFSRISCRYTLGLSATPNNRSDSFDIICHWNIGPILNLEEIPLYLDTYKKEKDVPVYVGKIVGLKYTGPRKYTENVLFNDGTTDYNKMIIQIMEDPYRLKLIISKLVNLIKDGYCTLVFSCRIHYLQELNKHLVKIISEHKKDNLFYNGFMLNNVKDSDITQILIGGSTDNEMVRAYNKSNVIFTTYPFFKEGISLPRINAIIYTTSKRNGYTQTNGRCIRPSYSDDEKKRKLENEKLRIIIDVIDVKTKYISQWYSRIVAHNELLGTKDNISKLGTQFSIEIEKIDYKDIEL